MLERLGIKDRREFVVFLSLILLVALTPAGKEASHPLVLGIYRTLIIVIVGCYAWSDRSRLPRLSPLFLGGVMALGTIMLISILRWPGSLFESAYLFYENILFIIAFIVLAHGATGRSPAWKHAILGAVVLINVGYVAGALMIEKRPLFGPFVNPNYLASFLLPWPCDLCRNGLRGVVDTNSNRRRSHRPLFVLRHRTDSVTRSNTGRTGLAGNGRLPCGKTPRDLAASHRSGRHTPCRPDGCTQPCAGSEVYGSWRA
jgi:hypothetical protein